MESRTIRSDEGSEEKSSKSYKTWNNNLRDASGATQVGILIVGAGPTGLGCATRLHQHGYSDWLIVDQAEEAGGLACTDLTKEGFYFDMGGHVIFSHYQYFDELIDAALGRGDTFWNVHQRVSYVRLKDRWVPYPFQNNLSALEVEDQESCLQGIVRAKIKASQLRSKPANFEEWIDQAMGEGIATLFMKPYNFKVWAVPVNKMQCGWLGERVATVDVDKAISNILNCTEEGNWGPNAVFRFPKEGGTGAIWKAVARLLPSSRQVYGKHKGKITQVDIDKQEVTLATGQKLRYEAMVSTIPLDKLLTWAGKGDVASQLHYSSSHIIGIGIRGVCPHGTKCWLYFPEDNCPFYRATIFSNYAKKNVPDSNICLPTICYGNCSIPNSVQAHSSPGPYWSLMFEVSESQYKAVNQNPVYLGHLTYSLPEIVKETILGAVATTLIREDDEIVSIYHRRLEHGYPTPTMERDDILSHTLPWLKSNEVWSRGRFGSYKYEVANQDHSLMIGVETADNILFGTEEMTLNHPNIVNSIKNTELLYTKRGAGIAWCGRSRDHC